MPIEFAPPSSSNLQGFQIPAAQYTDPLQTLAQMQQMRTQNIQQQSAQLGLQMAQMKMKSQKALLQAFADAGKEDEPAAAAPAPAPSSPLVAPPVPGTIGAPPVPGAFGAPPVIPAPPGAPPATAPLAQPQPPSGSVYLDRVFRNAVRNGVLPDDLFALQTHVLDIKSKTATLNKEQQGIYKDNADAVAGAYQQDIPDQGALNAVNNSLIARGVPQNMLMTAFPVANEHFTSKAQIQAHANGVQMLSQLVENQQKTATTEEAKQRTLQAGAQTAGAVATTAKTVLETKQLQSQLDWMDHLTPKTLADYVGNSIDKTKYPDLYARALNDATNARAMRKPELLQAAIDKYAAIASEQEKTIATETNPDVLRAREQVARINAQNRQNITIQGLGSVDQPSSTAQMVANYQVPLQTALARTPIAARNILLDQIKAVNPQFQEQYYESFKKAEENATSGKLGDSSRALNTMMGHLGVLNQAADALHNNDIQGLNRIANAIGAQLGSTAKTTYDTIVHRLGPEVTKAYIAGGGTSGERGSNEEDFSSNLAPKQIKQNIGISAYLADSLIKANQEQYNRGTYGRGQQKLMTDEAEGIRQRLVQQAPANLRGAAGGGHVIQIGTKQYRYNGSGNTADLKNYTEVK